MQQQDVSNPFAYLKNALEKDFANARVKMMEE